MSTLSLQQQKEIERLAVNTPNLKDRGKFGINKKTQAVKNGYYRLKDGRVIYLKDLYPEQKKTKKKDD